jgi:hypothetical protein
MKSCTYTVATLIVPKNTPVTSPRKFSTRHTETRIVSGFYKPSWIEVEGTFPFVPCFEKSIKETFGVSMNARCTENQATSFNVILHAQTSWLIRLLQPILHNA